MNATPFLIYVVEMYRHSKLKIQKMKYGLTVANSFAADIIMASVLSL